MRKPTEDELVIGWVAAWGIWGLVVLPLIYLHDDPNHSGSLNDIAVLITAFATVAIAGFTLALKRSTDQLFIATKQSADAATVAANAVIAAERPRVHLSKLKFSRMGGDIQDRTKLPEISIGFRNLGRSVAVILDIRVVMRIVGELPETPEYGERHIYIPTGQTIAPGDEYSLRQLYLDFKEGDVSTDPVLPFRAHFWVYGYIAYQDHLGDERRHGFVGLWMPPGTFSALGANSGEDFIWAGNKNYAYDT